MSSSSSTDVIHITSVYDDERHVYQFSSSSPIFPQLHQLTSAKYPLTPLYLHFVDDDGDQCRITNEAELREAIRVCGTRLTLLLSSSLPLPSSIPSPTRPLSSSSSSLSNPSPLPSLYTPSPHPTLPPSSSSDLMSQPYPSIDDYLSSDEEEIWSQARLSVKTQEVVEASVEGEEGEEKEFGVVALDSDEEGDEEKVVQDGSWFAPLPGPLPTVDVEEAGRVEVTEERMQPVEAKASDAVEETTAVEQKADAAKAQAEAFSDRRDQPLQQDGQKLADRVDVPTSEQPFLSPLHLPPPSPHEEEVQMAINDRLKAFYSTPASAPHHDAHLADLCKSFFSDPAVCHTISIHSAALIPVLVSSSFPLFLHELSVLNPALSSHPLLSYVFSLAALHPRTTCAVCTVSPIVGVRYSCSDCNANLCEECRGLGVHEANHVLLPLRVAGALPLPVSVPVPVVARPILERKEEPKLADRMREGGRKAWGEMEIRLHKLEKQLSQYAAEIRRVLEEVVEGVFPSHSRPVKDGEQPGSRQCDMRRSCLPSRSQHAMAAAVGSPSRELMGERKEAEKGRVKESWESEVEMIREMGLIGSAVDEQTVKELLKGSKGNVAQVVQWMIERLEMGK